MKTINTFFIVFTGGIVAFFSIFWIGSYEQKMKLIDELPLSFIYRFVGLSAIGLVFISLLLMFNYLFAKLIVKDVNAVELRKLAIRGFVSVILLALFGTLFFFCI
ncbi:hypothetical protein [Flavobacterium sp. 2]|uniref:hypothetical protein n=1 Tax=Flavobacterium sp. 2 TaxID=308053 RepID=UPI003CE6834C